MRYRTPHRRQTDKRGFKTKREADAFGAEVEVSKMRGDWEDSLNRISTRCQVCGEPLRNERATTNDQAMGGKTG
ncbi:Arm DNA-binding domain-containing protein [Mycobacterium fragae]|uniref:AP2-like integrase N-terminal domain-containing protein n=1 Tax=Mycobacterium fragae TaxID=1260918 RepID=A0A1X1UTI2_9MYCO|nr:Arm DNA-binding domain-containing protein [Mycobacterium fragae]ORV60117.1 hypothetical protein AWC06_14590 [Mycobacterium fragae]